MTEFHFIEHEGGTLITEDVIYNRLAQLTDERIEAILIRFKRSPKLIELRKVIINNKYNNSLINVSYVQFIKLLQLLL